MRAKNRSCETGEWEPENLPSVIHSIRTAIAATISLAVARLFRLPEAYWAAIATLVVMQSTLGATLLISVERVVAAALGALAGALGNLVHRKSSYLRGCGICAGAFVRRISYGEKRLLLCEHHARHHRVHSPLERPLDHCAPPLPKSLLESSLRWRLCGRSINLGLQNKSSSKLACSGGRVARDPRISQPTPLPATGNSFSRCGQRVGHQVRVKRIREIRVDAGSQRESQGCRQYAALGGRNTRSRPRDKSRRHAPPEVNRNQESSGATRNRVAHG